MRDDSPQGDIKMRNNTVKINCNYGFTLIELLVVVLIIGILAAVALPQYQKAVEKARAAEALTTISTLQKAVDVFTLSDSEYNGGDLLSSGQLDVELPSSQYFSYDADSTCITALRIEKEDGVALYELMSVKSDNQWRTVCQYHYAHTSNRGKKLCESLQSFGIEAEETNLQ